MWSYRRVPTAEFVAPCGTQSRVVTLDLSRRAVCVCDTRLVLDFAVHATDTVCTFTIDRDPWDGVTFEGTLKRRVQTVTGGAWSRPESIIPRFSVTSVPPWSAIAGTTLELEVTATTLTFVFIHSGDDAASVSTTAVPFYALPLDRVLTTSVERPGSTSRLLTLALDRTKSTLCVKCRGTPSLDTAKYTNTTTVRLLPTSDPDPDPDFRGHHLCRDLDTVLLRRTKK